MGLNVVGSYLASGARLGAGLFAHEGARKPEQLLELYEFEGCPFCRLVRDALTYLDFDARIFPCPKGSKRYRAQVRAMGGKEQFPYLVDPNTGREMYESADIIEYLFETYADRKPPLFFRAKPLNLISSSMASAFRATSGSRYRAAREPEQLLELWSFEESPYCRLVRERLCELELAYVLHNVGKGHPRELLPAKWRFESGREPAPSTRHRREMTERAGRVMVPYLVDPNTGFERFESDEILQYLDTTYAL